MIVCVDSQLGTGLSVSFTITGKIQVGAPQGFVAVTVTVVFPFPKVEPLPVPLPLPIVAPLKT